MGNKTSEVLQALEDELKFWTLQLSAADGELKKNVPAATVENPLLELVKITKLIKAHTTKVGIIYEPSKLGNLGEALVTTVSDLSKSFVLFIAALAQLCPEKTSQLFYDEIKMRAHNLVSAAIHFVDELKTMFDGFSTERSKAESTPECKLETDARLVSVGKIWNLCDDFTKLVEGGKLKVLEKHTKMHISFIEDGLDEFAEWAEKPDDVDDEDPFGFDDDFSDEEDEEDDDGSKPSMGNDLDEAEENQVSKDKEELTAYSKLWLQKFKLVKLLFLSTNKSLSTLTSGKSIDQIHQTESVIAREIDALIVELMLIRTLDEVVEKYALQIDESCFKIVALLRNNNKKSEGKVKWCSTWETKYKQFLEQMYK